MSNTTLDLRAALTPTGFRPTSLRGLSYEQLREHVLAYVQVTTQMRFAVGDLLCFCDQQHNDMLTQLEADTGLSRHTLHNYAWVAGAVPHSRRREPLTWSHHEAVSSLDADDQTRLLNKAEAERLNVDELRAVIREERNDQQTDDDDANPVVSVTDAARRVWTHAQRDGDRYLVPAEDMLALARAIGAAT